MNGLKLLHWLFGERVIRVLIAVWGDDIQKPLQESMDSIREPQK